MKISVQINLNNGWSNNAPAFHHVTGSDEAENFCLMLSHQFGNATVRLCYMPDNEVPCNTDYVSRLSGTYIQCTLPNQPETTQWVNELINHVTK
jgi:hypothetical protein